jgi:hypothetical protein
MFCTDEHQSARASGPSDRRGPMLARSFYLRRLNGIGHRRARYLSTAAA